MKKPHRSPRAGIDDGASVFPVVGVTASAGDVAPFTRLLPHLPSDTGMAFVIVPPPSAQSADELASVLARATSMPVAGATRKTAVKPNHIYVIPPARPMRIADSVLAPAPVSDKRLGQRPVDYFFRSLASDRKALGIAVVLSQTAASDVPGLQAIRDEGGIAIVQTENAVSPEEIGDALRRIGRLPDPSREALTGDFAKPFDRILELLRRELGVDFRAYKRGTIHRRIMRRIMLRRDESLETYAASLESNPGEVTALGDDLLIHVTRFFRDSATFAVLAREIAPRLLNDHPPDRPLRLWVPGCSAGQEVYSVAMCLLEAMPAGRDPVPLQIFGTDVSEHMIAVARKAVYSEAEASRLSPGRLKRFFTRCDGGYRIVKSIRDMCVFARQNVLADPPFSRIDLISCRNLLIYLEPAIQRQVVGTLHYALQPGGCLLVGQSESLRDFPDLFRQIDENRKFYGKRMRPAKGLQVVRDGSSGGQYDRPKLPIAGLGKLPAGELERTAERIVLSEYGLSWVLVNENLDILNSRGDLGPYMQFAPGRATLSLLRTSRDEVRAELCSLLEKARGGETNVHSSFLHAENGVVRRSRIEVRRIAAVGGSGDFGFLIVFSPAALPGKAGISAAPGGRTERNATHLLRQELTLANQRLQAILAERDSANEELVSANEEIQASNEELQSINEELETSKEELLSSNEELNTLNDELQNRNQELGYLSDDLTNLLSSIALPILMVDNELRIKRITPAAERLFNVRPGDVGRPIGDIRLRLSEDDLDSRIRRVIDRLAGEEIEVLDREGRWHLLRIRPYRSGDNRIEGAVLTMLDIDQLRRAQTAADLARSFAEAVVESVQIPLLVLKVNLKIRVANDAFLTAYGLRAADVQNRSLDEVDQTRWNMPAFKQAMERLVSEETSSEDFECLQNSTVAGKRTVLIGARRVLQQGSRQILIAIQDITTQRRAEKLMTKERTRLKRSVRKTANALLESEDALRLSRAELRALTGSLLHAQDEERRRVSRELHDDVSQNVVKLQFDIEALEQTLPHDREREKQRLLAVRDDAARLSSDLSRIAHALHPATLDCLGLTAALSAYASEFSQRTDIPVEFNTAGVPEEIPPEIAGSFYRIAQEALRNIARHSGAPASISLAGEETCLTLAIRDSGPGFDRDAVRGRGGLGLVSMEERARLIHASFAIDTAPEQGVLITVSAPLSVAV